jgi:hypothetical protein
MDSLGSIRSSLDSLSTPQLALGVLALAEMALPNKGTRYLAISFVLSQIVLAIATIRLLLRRYSQIIEMAPAASQ